MKCYYHPDREATATCSVCGKPICDEDIAGYRTGKPVCKICAITTAVEQHAKGKSEEKQKLAQLRRQREKEKEIRSRRTLIILLAVGLILIAADVGFYLYAKSSVKIENEPIKIGEIKTDEGENDIYAIGGMLLSAVMQYKLDNGKYPDDIESLISGGYISKDIADVALDEGIYFSVSGDSLYILSESNDSFSIAIGGGL